MDNLAEYIKRNKPTVTKIMEEFPALYMLHYQGIERLVDSNTERRNMKPHVMVVHGMTGCGKSTYVMNYAYEKWGANNVYVYDALSPKTEWWQNYNGQECVILEDFTPEMLPRQRFLRITDRYNCRVPFKGGSKDLLAKEILITSNFTPTAWYPGVTRDIASTILRRIDLCFKVCMVITGYTTVVDENGKLESKPVPLKNAKGELVYEWILDPANMCPRDTSDYNTWLAQLNTNNEYTIRTPDLSFVDTLLDHVEASGVGTDIQSPEADDDFSFRIPEIAHLSLVDDLVDPFAGILPPDEEYFNNDIFL